MGPWRRGGNRREPAAAQDPRRLFAWHMGAERRKDQA
jgi:hypothetical protein